MMPAGRGWGSVAVMEFTFSPEDELFGKEVTGSMRANVPAGLARRTCIGTQPPAREDVKTWQDILHKKGWRARTEHNGSEMQQRVTELQVTAIGACALRFVHNGDSAIWPADVPGRTAQCLFTRPATIFGGTQEVQNNIIAKLAFGR